MKRRFNELLRSELSLQRREKLRELENALCSLSDADLSLIVEANAPVTDKVTLGAFLVRQKTAKKILKARQSRNIETRRRERNANLSQSLIAFEASLIQELSKLSNDELRLIVGEKPVGLVDPELARFQLRQRAAKKVLSDRTNKTRQPKQPAGQKLPAKGTQRLHWKLSTPDSNVDEVWNRPRWV